MVKSSSSSENEVYDNSLCSKSCKKNTDSLNTKITELSEKLSDCKTNLYHYKLGISQIEARLVEFKIQEIKFCEKIRGLEFNVESKNNRIERLTNELKELKKEKEGLDSKLTGLPKFADDTITDYSRPSPSIESNLNDLQSSNSSVSENGESSSSILSKPVITFVKAADSPTDSGCSRHMTGNISYLSDYELYDGGYVSFGQGGGKITGKDSDYGGATQDRKSTTGGCQFLGRRLISWQCKKQTIVTTSTTKAEYVAADSSCGQVLWIQNQLLDYGHHFIRDCFEKKLINVDHIHIDDNVADLLTKPFDARQFQYLVIVDFVEASHIRYALTINPTVYVSHIRQFWSTARIETTNEGTKILATVDGKLMTISESSIRRNLKLNDEEGINTLPNAELFENLALMGVNSPSFLSRTVPLFDSMLVTPGEGSGTPTEPHHTPSPEAQQSPHNDSPSPIHPTATTETIPTLTPTEIPTLRQYSRRAKITQSTSLPTTADELASPFGDDSQGEAFPTQTEMAIKIAAQDLEISNLKARIKMFEDKDGGGAEPSLEDAPIKGRSLETGEEAGVEKSNERRSNDIEELVNVLTSLDAANILTSGVQVVSVPPAAEVSTIGIPTGSGLVPTASPIFTTASVVIPYSRRKGKEKMVESDTPKKKKLQEQINVQMAREIEEQMARKDQRMNEQIARDAEIARIHTKEELQMLIDGLDRNNEVIAKHLHKYEQAAAELTIGEKIELINELVKYQDHHAKILKYQDKQSKPLSKKQQREFYMSVLKSHSGWKTNHFKGMTLEEIKEKFIPVWKQIEDFVPMASKDEGERMKRKGLRDQDIFMLVEKDYPLRKGLAIVMISNKLQVENYSQMANDLIMKIHNIANSPRQRYD
nr:hypothetical protein [Tanacetum cinerariifolium]